MFCQAKKAKDRYHPPAFAFPSLAAKYFRKNATDRLQMVQGYDIRKWASIPQAVCLDSLLTLRRAINKLGILERAGSAWKTLHCVIIGIVGDGNCLFRALSVHLAGTEKGHKAVRSAQ